MKKCLETMNYLMILLKYKKEEIKPSKFLSYKILKQFMILRINQKIIQHLEVQWINPINLTQHKLKSNLNKI